MTTQTKWVFDSQIKDALDIDQAYTAEDAKVTMINKAVTATLENLLGRCLTKQAYTEYFNSKANYQRYSDVYGNSATGYGAAYKEIKYYLKNYPVDTSETFEVHYEPDSNIDGATLLDPTLYVFDAEQGILSITKAVGNYPKAIRVVYTAGYESTTEDADTALSENIPADLVQAALWQASHVYDKTKLSNINVRESRGQGSTNSSRYVNIHAIAPEALGVIAQYKRRFFRSV